MSSWCCTPPGPAPGDHVAAWLTACRDTWPAASEQWAALDGLLHQYLACATSGARLGTHRCARPGCSTAATGRQRP